MNSSRINRRQFTVGSAAALLSASLFTIPTMARISESHTTVDGFAEIGWDPDLWNVDGDPEDTTMLLRNLAYERYGDDTYFLRISSESPEFGDAHPEEAIELHIADWFVQGMLTSTIVDRWVTDSSFGYLFVSGAPDNRTFITFDYRQVPSDPEFWVSSSLVVDQVLFDEETTAEMLDGVTINGEQLISERTTEELIELFTEYYDLES